MLNKLVSLTAAASMMLSVASPAFAGDTVNIKNNGADSYNKVKINKTVKNKKTQTNITTFSSVVGVGQNTGGNKIVGSTGGDNSITTGNNNSTVTIANEGGSNYLSNDNCGCTPGDLDATIKLNGADSTNKIEYSTYSSNKTYQTNSLTVINGVEVGQNTGDDQIKNATSGEGSDPSITTGNNTSTVEIGNVGGGNNLGDTML